MAEGAAVMSQEYRFARFDRFDERLLAKNCAIFSPETSTKVTAYASCSFFYENLISQTHFSSSSPTPLPTPPFTSSRKKGSAVFNILQFSRWNPELKRISYGREQKKTLSSSKSRWHSDIFCSPQESTRFIFYYHFLPPRFGNIQMKFSSASFIPADKILSLFLPSSSSCSKHKCIIYLCLSTLGWIITQMLESVHGG